MNKADSKLPLVSIVVSNYNGWKFHLLEPCLRSILNISYPNFEVILVDNASSDGSVEFSRRLFGPDPHFRIVANSGNVYSQGLNMGIAKCKGEYVVFFNNDIKVDPEYLRELIKVLEVDKSIGLAQGKLLLESDPEKIDCVGETMDIYGNPAALGRGENDRGKYERIVEILSASGSASIARRSVLNEVGGFDAKFFIGYEDMDLSLRIRLRGYRVVYIPKAIVYHKRTATDSASEIRAKVKYHFNKNRIATLIKNYSSRNLLIALPINLLLYFSAFTYELVVKRDIKWAIPRLTALLWNMKEIRYVLSQRRVVQRDLRRVSDNEILRLMPKRELVKTILDFVRK